MCDYQTVSYVNKSRTKGDIVQGEKHKRSLRDIWAYSTVEPLIMRRARSKRPNGTNHEPKRLRSGNLPGGVSVHNTREG